MPPIANGAACVPTHMPDAQGQRTWTGRPTAKPRGIARALQVRSIGPMNPDASAH